MLIIGKYKQNQQSYLYDRQNKISSNVRNGSLKVG